MSDKPAAPGARQHFVPAAVIGRFSTDTARAARDRRVWVASRGVASTFLQAARNVFVRNHAYTLRLSQQGGLVDRAWTYEQDLPIALNDLVSSAARGDTSMDGRLWIKCLVPYCAATFIRNPDFDIRYQQRVDLARADGIYNLAFTDEQDAFLAAQDVLSARPPLPSSAPERLDVMNRARVIEMARLCMPVAACSWTVIKLDERDESLILSDAGYVEDSGGDILGFDYVFPIGPRFAIGLQAQQTRLICRGEFPRGWRTPISFRQGEPGLASRVNDLSAQACTLALIADDEALAQKYRPKTVQRQTRSREPRLLSAMDRSVACAIELDWLHLASTLYEYFPGDSRVRNFQRNLDVILKYGLIGSMIVTSNRPNLRAPSLFARGAEIWCSIPTSVLFDGHDGAFVTWEGADLQSPFDSRFGTHEAEANGRSK